VQAEPERTKAAERALATRQALIELAGDLFAERGYVQTSIRDIARRAAVTSGAIYGHFRNKADLLAEAINVETLEQLEAETLYLGIELDHVETLTRLAREFPRRRRLRALIVQGAAAAQQDGETRTRLREEQLSHIATWLEGFQRERVRLGIHPSLDMDAALLYVWAAEVGLGVLEGLGIEPSAKAWADIQNHVARSWALPPDDQTRRAPRKRRGRTSPPNL
jgi:AcrR family transcriptional regulator